ncbi:MAG TPA: class I SAM-dependent methyltransferase [Armatimonadota bacterium]
MMPTPICPLCQTACHDKRFTERQHDLLVCHDCGLLFIHPYPEDVAHRQEAVREYDFAEYSAVTAATHYRSEVIFYQGYYPLIAAECAQARSFLDVGCGTGHLLELLGETYPQLHREGIELNRGRAAVARQHADCTIHEVPVESFRSKRSYDVITLINVLSHIPSFDRLFTALQGLLSPQGKLIIKIGEVSAQAEKNDLFDWGMPDHLHFCGFNTMEYLCQRYDFRIATHQRVPYSLEFFAPTRWRSPGTNAVRNVAKTLVSSLPFVLPALAKLYDMKHGGKIFSSFIVLTRQP